MMDYERLIKRIKCPQIHSCPMDDEYPSCNACQKSVKQDAADAITALLAEVKRWKTVHHQAAINWQQENAECRKLEAELEQSEKALEALQAISINSSRDIILSWLKQPAEED